MSIASKRRAMSPEISPTVDGHDADAALQSAYRDLGAGELDGAESSFRHVLENTGESAKALNGLGIVASMRGHTGTAVRLYRQAIEIAPDYTLARDNLFQVLVVEGRRQVQSGKTGQAEATLDAAHALLAGDGGGEEQADARKSLGYAFTQLGREYRRASGDARRAAGILRKARALVPDDANLRIALDIALHSSGLRATLGDYTDRVVETAIGRHLLIACFPKSGSTFLKSVLMEVTGFPEQNLTFAHGQNETGLYLPDLVASATNDTVTQLHMRPSDSNVRLMQGFAIRPIVLVRNIYDVLLSYKEFHDRYAQEISFYERYDALDETQCFDVMVDDRAPWYLGFFAGWQRAVRSGRIDGFWLTYEELMQDKVGKIDEILRFYHIDRPRREIAGAIDRASTNKTATHFNKGVVGRGRAHFTDRQVEQISRIASHHPDIDFSLIGL